MAYRTSPTNIGLWLLSALAAHDFGYLTIGEVLGAHGQNGAFRARVLTEFPERLSKGARFFIDGNPYTVESSSTIKDIASLGILDHRGMPGTVGLLQEFLAAIVLQIIDPPAQKPKRRNQQRHQDGRHSRGKQQHLGPCRQLSSARSDCPAGFLTTASWKGISIKTAPVTTPPQMLGKMTRKSGNYAGRI